MSLIISMMVPDCIVVASDSCMTLETSETNKDGIQNLVAVSYTEHTPKMVVFQERLVVTYCGSMFVNSTLSVLQFLKDLRSKVTKNMNPAILCDRILSEYLRLSSDDASTIFFVSGYQDKIGFIYRINTTLKEIKPYFENDKFGAAFGGQTKFVCDMLSSVADYTSVSVKDAVQLVSTMMDCISSLSKFWKDQSVGGDIDIYVMFRDKGSKSGWARADQAIPILPYGYKKASFQ